MKGALLAAAGAVVLAAVLGSMMLLDGASENPPPRPVAAVDVGQPATAVPKSRSEITLSFAPLVKTTAPSVVNVYAAREVAPQRSPFAGDPFFGQFFGQRLERRPRIESSLGSGVIVTSDGLVVTNNHVVADADEVKVAFADGREFESDIVLKDAEADLAILKIRGEGPYPALPIANSDEVEIGDLVLAIGNPFGIGQTVTNGIVSAVARSQIGISDFGFFIQTDAAINPGNSGGALIDMHGRLVGVNTAIFSRSGGSNGIGFAIPSNMVQSFLRAAENGGGFERPFVGAGFTPITPDIAEALGLERPTGALVQSVMEGGPLDQAGVAVGDVVLSLNGREIANPDALGYRLATAGIGERVELAVLRGETERTISLELKAAPEIPPRDERLLGGRTPLAGATVANLSPRLAGELEMPQDKTGVVVMQIQRGTYAARFGLRPKDIVMVVNGERITSTEQLEAVLDTPVYGWDFEVERDGRVLSQRVR